MNMPILIPDELVKAVENRRSVVAFVGSGLSRAVGLPSWSELLRDLVEVARPSVPLQNVSDLNAAVRAIDEGRFINAATLISRAIGDAIGGDFVRSTVARRIRNCPVSQNRSHEILLRLGFPAIVTTNYDMLFEARLQQLGIPRIPSYSRTGFVRNVRLDSDTRFIVHLHGDVDHEPDIVVRWQEYDDLLRSGALEHLRSLLSNKKVLWIGCGHGDPDLWLALAQCRAYPMPRSFQLVEDSDRELVSVCHARGIQPIFIPSYRHIELFLIDLSGLTGTDLNAEVLVRQDSQVAALNDLGQRITDCLLAGPLARLPLQAELIDPEILHRGAELPHHLDDLFSGWLSSEQPRRRIAIIAPPAVGKTVLLSRLAKWLRERNAAAVGLRPIVIYLSSDNLREPVTRTSASVWEQLVRQADADTSPYTRELRPWLLDRWRDEGKIFLLFDGIDEFGARRKGELNELLDQLACLTKLGISVFLTCRTVFWATQVAPEQRALWDEYDIDPPSAGAIQAKVPPPGLGPFAYDEKGNLRPGICNHLVLKCILALRAGQESPRPYGSRSEVYEEWARLVSEGAQRFGSRILSSQWIDIFKDTAFRLLTGRKLYVSLPKLPDHETVPLWECLATDVLTASGNDQGVKFYHESLNEFFISWVLEDSYRALLDLRLDPPVLRDLPLARVDLDFPQPVVYGFLRERLPHDYVHTLQRILKSSVIPSLDPRLLRNLVECIGFIYTDASDVGEMVHCLLDLIDSDLDTLVRYNAARALERIHPLAPKPYYDFMSDWGDRDWSNEWKQAEEDGICPWAIRAHRTHGEDLIPRRPGKHPVLAVLRSGPLDTKLQIDVSERLGKILQNLLADPSTDPWLLINCSYAWVRWFHSGHTGLLEEIRGLVDHRSQDAKAAEKALADKGGEEAARASKVLEHIGYARENLREWVGNSKLPCA